MGLVPGFEVVDRVVSMKSGLEGRNNVQDRGEGVAAHAVSMKSGLEGRNNPHKTNLKWGPCLLSQ